MTRLGNMNGLFGEDPDLIEVGIGELAVARAPKRLMTPALGSCVGVAVFCLETKSGGLAHVMLPKPAGERVGDPARFADFAVPELVRLLVARGCRRADLRAKIAGGAAMFKGEEFIAGIGQRNLSEVRRQLDLLGIPVSGEDVGEAHARTVEIDLTTGVMQVRSYQFGLVMV